MLHLLSPSQLMKISISQLSNSVHLIDIILIRQNLTLVGFTSGQEILFGGSWTSVRQSMALMSLI